MVFYKSPEKLFLAAMNFFQSLSMTVAVSIYVGQTAPADMIKTLVCAFCASVMLTTFVRVHEFGVWVGRLLRCKKPGVQYLVENLATGGLMGILMNFFMTFMNIGLTSQLPTAFFHTLLYSIAVSAVASIVSNWIARLIVGKAYGKN